jgi:hypothetical protein
MLPRLAHRSEARWYVWSDGKPRRPGGHEAGCPQQLDFSSVARLGGVPPYPVLLPLLLQAAPDLNWRNRPSKAMFGSTSWLIGASRASGWTLLTPCSRIPGARLPRLAAQASRAIRVSTIHRDWPAWLHDVIRRMRALVDSYPIRALIRELYLPDAKSGRMVRRAKQDGAAANGHGEGFTAITTSFSGLRAHIEAQTLLHGRQPVSSTP